MTRFAIPLSIAVAASVATAAQQPVDPAQSRPATNMVVRLDPTVDALVR